MIDTTANVVISKANEVFLKINSEPHIEYELRDYFTFEVEGAKFMPQYRNRNWNGEIHLFDLRSKKIRDKDTMQKYLDADDKLSNSSLKIDYYDTMLVYLESILKVIQNRTFQIKNAIEFMRFNSGLG